MFKPTHRHADAGEYELVEEGSMKLESGEWVRAVFYRGRDGQLRATTRARFAERFAAIPIKPI